MILYLDTSSLVKLYLEEAHSDSVRQWVEEAEIIATSRVAYPETMSALTRRTRSGDISRSGFEKVREAFNDQWDQLAKISMNEIIAGALAVKHGLRGFDAIHLEAALSVRADNNDVSVTFSSFDTQLNKAAVSEGFQVFNAQTSVEK